LLSVPSVPETCCLHFSPHLLLFFGFPLSLCCMFCSAVVISSVLMSYTSFFSAVTVSDLSQLFSSKLLNSIHVNWWSAKPVVYHFFHSWSHYVLVSLTSLG